MKRRFVVSVGSSLAVTPLHAQALLLALDYLLTVARKDTMVTNLEVAGQSGEAFERALSALSQVARAR